MNFIIYRFLLCFFLSLLLHGNANCSSDTINVKNYGAVGDGRTNDYPYLKAAVSALNTKKNGILFFPKGNYYIQNYISKENEISDIVFDNCDQISIIGEGAKITVNGAIYRKADHITHNGKYKYSDTKTVMPILLRNCQNVTITGIEIDGQVNKIKNAPGIAEAPGHLIGIYGSKNVTLENLSLHHAMCDGLYIAHSANRTSENIQAKNVVVSNCGRQGMSIVGLLKGSFFDCVFKDTGLTDGDFDGFLPKAGVDIEPGTVDAKVESILFVKCTFANNLGTQFAVSAPDRTNDIVLNNCYIDAQTSHVTAQVILTAKNIVISNCEINCGSGSIYPMWLSNFGSNCTIKNCYIKSKASGIVSVPKKDTDDYSVTIDNNTFFYTGDSTLKSFFPYISTSRKTEFINNTVIIPSKVQKTKGINVLIRDIKTISNNLFVDENGLNIPEKSILLKKLP